MTTCTMTDAALLHVQDILSRYADGSVLCLSVKKSGCAGFGFAPSIEKAPIDGYTKVQVHADFDMYVDPRYLNLVDGMQIDIVQKELGQRQLKFMNPTLADECGCGESFSLPEDDK